MIAPPTREETLSRLMRQSPQHRRVQIGKPIALKREIAKIDRHWPDDVETRDRDPERLVRELRQKLERHPANDAWQGYSWADLERAARALLATELRRHPEFKDLTPFLLRQLHSTTKRRYARTMFRLYLRSFDAESDWSRQLAERLKSCFKQVGLGIDQAVTMGIFEPRTAVRRIVDYMIEQTDPFNKLKAAGIEAPHGQGLMERAHREFVRRHSDRSIREDPNASYRLCAWIVPPSPSGSGAGQPMEAGAELVLDRLLLPWQGGATAPPEELKRLIETILVRHFGDPRVSQEGVWRRCSEDARAVFLRWLVGETLKLFFEIISKADKSHMWPNRKDFWIDLHEQGKIQDAWFVLSPRGQDVAESMQRSGGVPLPFSRNGSDKSDDRKKCLLIMRIRDHRWGDRWVVEGSHSFKTHVFQPGYDRIQFPHPDRYDCQRFRDEAGVGRAEGFVHNQAWERRVRQALFG